MKKNLLTLLFGISFLFVGVSIVRAEVPYPSVGTVNFSKKSISVNAGKLERIKSSIEKGEAMHRLMYLDCLDSLEQLEAIAEAATSACGGADGSGTRAGNCDAWLTYATNAGNAFEAAGCGGLLPGGTVTAKNINRKIWMIHVKAVGIS